MSHKKDARLIWANLEANLLKGVYLSFQHTFYNTTNMATVDNLNTDIQNIHMMIIHIHQR